MRIHNPAITGSLSISGSGLTIDSIGTISGSAASTGSFGDGHIAHKLGIGTVSPSSALAVSYTHLTLPTIYSV